MKPPPEVIWNEVECGGYSADLELWAELAAERPGPVLELGCGAGRVVVHLSRGTEELVIGLDRDSELVGAVWEKTHQSGRSGDAEIGDVRGFELYTEFQLALAPMQLIQLLEERMDRICCLSCVADHLRPDGRAAFALVEDLPAIPAAEAEPALPDVREVDGSVYSSQPLPPEVDERRIVLRRLRQTVDPDGEISEQLNEVVLQRLSAETLEAEAAEVGLMPLERRQIPATEAHVGSTVVILGKEPA